MRKEYLNKKVYKKIVAGTMAVTLAVTTTTVYNAKASKEEDSREEGAVAEDKESEVKDALEKIVSIDEKAVDKEEMVYLISDSQGNVQKTIVSDRLYNRDHLSTIQDKSDLSDIENVKGDETFTVKGEELEWKTDGNDIYYQGTTTKEAPVSVGITYYLDGKEIAPEELAGKDGRVKIRFDYTNKEKVTKTIDGAEEEIYVPFAAVSGMILGDNFTNIEVENGKTISDGDHNVVVGVAMPGLKESLGIEEEDLEDVSIPEYVAVEADVTDFSLDMTMTMIVNHSELDISNIDLTDVDEKVDEITDATEQLEDGSITLSAGIGTLRESYDPFKSGVYTLKDGVISYTDGAKELAKGIRSLHDSVPALKKGVKSIKKGVDAVYDNFGTKKNDKSIRGGMKQLADGSKSLDGGASTLKNGTASLITGVNTLDTGAQSLYTGTKSLYAGTKSLYTGAEGLYTGTTSLNAGVTALTGAIKTLGTTVTNSEKAIYEELAKSGINSYDEAEKALSDAKKLQSTLLAAIAYDTYAGLEAYGVTDSKSAAKLLTSITEQIDSLTKAIASIDVLDKMAAPLTEKTADIAALEAGAKQVVDGAKQVRDGAKQVDAGAKQVDAGAKQVSEGTSLLKSNVKQLDDGAGSLATGAASLNTGASTLQGGIEQLYTKAISPLYKGVDELYDSIPELKSGVEKLYKGANKLVSNNKKLKNGVSELASGADELADGISALDEGADELADGMKKFNEEGIKKIVDAYNKDIKSLVNRINAVIEAGEEYEIFTSKADDTNASVKFIIKTDEVK